MFRLMIYLATTLQGTATAAVQQSALQPAGVQAETIFGLWNFTLALCTAVFVAVLLALGLALWKARQARRAQTDGAPDLEPLHRPERRVHRTHPRRQRGPCLGASDLRVGIPECPARRVGEP